MNATHLELLRRLEQFPLDSPEATLPFSARLARENHWPPTYTQRVIAEYKRFAFLAVVAGHPVSPSEEVDQAWHLHLTYTENYWKSFCGEVLGKPLHHHPTRGGAGEQAKFEDWYARTLESYAAFFGEPAPADVWPTPQARREEPHRFVRVDRARAWIIPKPRLPVLRKSFAGSALLLLAALCSGAMFARGAWPFDRRGPEFLGFYLLLTAVCFALAIWLRNKLRPPIDPPAKDDLEIEPYAMAYLNGGKILAVNTAIANLANRHLLKVDAKKKTVSTTGLIEPTAHYLEKVIHAEASPPDGAAISAVRLAAKPIVEGIANDLKDRGLVVADRPAQKALWLPLFVACLPVMFGAIKIMIGVSRDRPVILLVILCVFTLVIALLGFARRPLRSRRGDATFEQLKTNYSSISRLRGKLTTLTPPEFAISVGLFGLIALDGTVLAELRHDLQPPRNDSAGGSCGGGCGGGGCGGGCGGCGGD